LFKSRADRAFFLTLLPFALASAGILAVFISTLALGSLESLSEYGLSLLSRNIWDPENEVYGVLGPLIGTFATSLIGVAYSMVLSIPLAVFMSDYLKGVLREFFSSMVELMGGMPTIIYAVWGMNHLAPFMRDYVLATLHSKLGFLPLFSCRPLTGSSLMTAGVAIGVSLVPYMTALIYESYRMVPEALREACLGIGATRYESTKLMISLLKPAILASALLGLARGVGETTIAVMTVGNSMYVGACLIGPGYTVSALIASQYGNANLYRYAESVLQFSALVILLTTLALSSIGLVLMGKWRSRILV